MTQCQDQTQRLKLKWTCQGTEPESTWLRSLCRLVPFEVGFWSTFRYFGVKFLHFRGALYITPIFGRFCGILHSGIPTDFSWSQLGFNEAEVLPGWYEPGRWWHRRSMQDGIFVHVRSMLELRSGSVLQDFQHRHWRLHFGDTGDPFIAGCDIWCWCEKPTLSCASATVDPTASVPWPFLQLELCWPLVRRMATWASLASASFITKFC